MKIGDQSVRGYLAMTLVRAGNSFKIRDDSFNVVPPSPQPKPASNEVRSRETCVLRAPLRRQRARAKGLGFRIHRYKTFSIHNEAAAFFGPIEAIAEPAAGPEAA
jgi:hypothetical protein